MMCDKLYLIYAKKDLVDNIFVSIGMPMDILGEDYILYAITDKTKYKKTFLKERSNIFKVKSYYKDEIENYGEFKEKYNKYFLKYYKYINNFSKYTLEILSTKYEFNEVHTYWFDHIIDVSKIGFINTDNVKIFNKKYLNLFSKMKLDSMFNVFGDYDYPQDDYEFSYPTNDNDPNTIHLYRNISTIDHGDMIYEAYLSGNEDNIFIRLFGKMFK